MVELTDTARSALDASKALGVPVGAIVKTLIFIIQNDDEVTPIVCLISGDMLCDTSQISQVLNIDGKVNQLKNCMIELCDSTVTRKHVKIKFKDC